MYTIEQEIIGVINEDVRNVITLLTEKKKGWFQKCMCFPKLLKYEDHDLWVITDDNDSSYQIVYDQNHKKYGLICNLINDQIIYLGSMGDLLETIENM